MVFRQMNASRRASGFRCRSSIRTDAWVDEREPALGKTGKLAEAVRYAKQQRVYVRLEDRRRRQTRVGLACSPFHRAAAAPLRRVATRVVAAACALNPEACHVDGSGNP